MTLLTGRQIAHFHTLGFVRIPSALRPREVDEFDIHFEAVIASERTKNDDSEAGQRIFPQGHRVIVPLIEADPFFYNLLDHPNLAAIADDLLGEDCIFYGSSDGQIHCSDTNWHRDGQTSLTAIRRQADLLPRRYSARKRLPEPNSRQPSLAAGLHRSGATGRCTRTRLQCTPTTRAL